jgi:transcriptional regulator with XRE-family HTH domain
VDTSSATPVDRLKAFAADRGWNQAELAKALRCRQPHVSRVFRGEKGVGLRLAASIERITDGAIKATEWDVDESREAVR